MTPRPASDTLTSPGSVWPSMRLLALIAGLWAVGAVAIVLLTDAGVVEAVLLLAIGACVVLLFWGQRRATAILRELTRQSQDRAERDRRLTGKLEAVTTAITESTAEQLASQLNTELTAQRETQAQLGRRLDALASAALTTAQVREVSRSVVHDGVIATTQRVRAATAHQLRDTFAQVEALGTLHATLRPDRPVPATRGWALSPDLLLVLVDLVIRNRPRLIVECGSGSSTLWAALTMRQFDIPGRIVSLEHQEDFAAKTRSVLEQHGVSHLADIRVAPLAPAVLPGRQSTEPDLPWYEAATWQDLHDIDLLLVDGPPQDTGPMARFPALPLLGPRCSRSVEIVVDDLIREDEQRMVDEWLVADPAWDVENLRVEKRAAILRRSISSSSRP